MSRQSQIPIQPLVASRLQANENVQSMTSIILEPLDVLQSLSRSLFVSLSPPHTKPPPIPAISDILACDTQLALAIELARTHQVNQRKIEALQEEIFDLDARIRDICSQLHRGKTDLEVVIEEGEKRIKATEEAKQAAIPYPELLAYAQSLSAFTSAPPNMPDLNLPGQLPPPLFFPPFPNEEKMRRGRLDAEAPLGLLGETHSVGRPPMTSPKPPEPQNLAPAIHPYRQDLRPQQQPFDFDLDLNPDL